jgi:hypothetical protein
MIKSKIVYVAGGQEYANAIGNTEGVYIADLDNPIVWQTKKNNGKRYWIGDFWEPHYPPVVGGRGYIDIKSRDYDLCPDVDTWLAVGEFEEDPSFYELYFWALSAKMLRAVSAYYDLPYPISEEIGLELDTTPTNMALKWIEGVPIVVASIKFKDDLPTMLKLYTYRKVTDE